MSKETDEPPKEDDQKEDSKDQDDKTPQTESNEEKVTRDDEPTEDKGEGQKALSIDDSAYVLDDRTVLAQVGVNNIQDNKPPTDTQCKATDSAAGYTDEKEQLLQEAILLLEKQVEEVKEGCLVAASAITATAILQMAMVTEVRHGSAAS